MANFSPATTEEIRGYPWFEFLVSSARISRATAIQYGLIAAGIAVAIIVAVQTLGTNLNTTFSACRPP